jgi:hypothetical protein
MNILLAEAVIATFKTDDARRHSENISRFRHSTWAGTYSWLDASGLALYFLERLRTLGIESCLPPEVLHRLAQNASDNRIRTALMFEEFLGLNLEFQKAGLSYANLKGFTLAPDACAGISLRCQLDLDFIVACADISGCEPILEKRGYRLAGTGENVREFKADSGQLPSFGDLYKAKPQRSVEIHFNDPAEQKKIFPESDNLSRPDFKTWGEFHFPVLSECDKFLGQAIHLFKHLNGEWTRASWMLEYANYINFHHKNETLWSEVRQHMLNEPDIKLAVGAATLISEKNFEILSLPNVLKWAIQELPELVGLWIERYGKKIILSEFPGTKLYLLLQGALANNKINWSDGINKLFPFHRPAKITVGYESARLLLSFKQMQTETSYFLFRLWFHVKHGFVYMIEAVRWRRCIASLQS